MPAYSAQRKRRERYRMHESPEPRKTGNFNSKNSSIERAVFKDKISLFFDRTADFCMGQKRNHENFERNVRLFNRIQRSRPQK